MSIQNKFMNRIFRRVHGVVWDVISGGTGLKTEAGIHTVTFDAEGNATPNVNPISSMGLALPAFATQTAFDDVVRGDIIVGDQHIIGWVVDKTGASFRVLDHNGHTKTYTPPKVAVFNTSGVLVVKNLINLTGGAEGATNFASNLLPLMLLGGGKDDSKLEKLLPLLLMQSAGGTGAAAGGAAGGLNPLLLMTLLGGDKGGSKTDKLLPLLLMGGLGGAGGAGGLNPLVMMSLLGDEGGLESLLGNAKFGSDEDDDVATFRAPPLVATGRGGVPPLNRF